MYLYFNIYSSNLLNDLLINNLILFPLFFITFFFILISFCLYFSLWNIFKIFFFTEALLLLSVIFITQYSNICIYETTFHYFYCQLILAAAASEAALFLGLFSHLYDKQFIHWISKKKEVDANKLYFFLLKTLKI